MANAERAKLADAKDPLEGFLEMPNRGCSQLAVAILSEDVLLPNALVRSVPLKSSLVYL